MKSLGHIETAKRVLLAEAKGIAQLSDLLDENFNHAIKTIVDTKAYVIVTGVGKSGHIGRKISASFASTGTPSFFMHPTEASHGDLGMITAQCTVLAISSSGESREMVDTLSYCQKNAIPVISITQNSNSTLGRASNIVLLLPKISEVCVNGLAPTTSTTNTLALGDALVVAAMTDKGVSQEDFGRHHPGGKLGRRLQTIEDWLFLNPHDIPKVTSNTPMDETITAISVGGNGCVAVVDTENQFLGMVTDGDLRRAMAGNFFDLRASDVMTCSPMTLSKTMVMSSVIDLFTSRRISNAFVVDVGMPIGVVHMKMLLKEGYV